MGKTISFVNVLGGTGKSTLSVAIAHALAGSREWSKNVLVVDLSVHAGASQYLLGARRYSEMVAGAGCRAFWEVPCAQSVSSDPGACVSSALSNSIVNVATYKPGGARVDLVPALPSDNALDDVLRRHVALPRLALAGVNTDYDLVVIDWAPTNLLTMPAVFFASDYLVLPVNPDPLASAGLEVIADALNGFRDRHRDHAVEVAGVVLNCATMQQRAWNEGSIREGHETARRLGWRFFEAPQKYSHTIAANLSRGEPMFSAGEVWPRPKDPERSFVDELAAAIGL